MIKIENVSIFNFVLDATDIKPSMIGTTKLEIRLPQSHWL